MNGYNAYNAFSGHPVQVLLERRFKLILKEGYRCNAFLNGYRSAISLVNKHYAASQFENMFLKSQELYRENKRLKARIAELEGMAAEITLIKQRNT
jgi:cell shape-determining protein MreC